MSEDSIKTSKFYNPTMPINQQVFNYQDFLPLYNQNFADAN